MYICIYAYKYVHTYIYIYIYIYTFVYISHCNKHRANPCNSLQHAETYCNIMRHIATNCNTLQHTSLWCFSKFISVSALPLKNKYSLFVHCNTHCNSVEPTRTHCNTLQHVPKNRFVHLFLWARNPQKTLIRLLCTDKTATHCNTLQQTATWRTFVPVLLSSPAPQRDRFVYHALRYTLQHVVNTLQRTATHCNTLQHTATHTYPGECTTPQRHKYVQLCTAAHTAPRV